MDNTTQVCGKCTPIDFNCRKFTTNSDPLAYAQGYSDELCVITCSAIYLPTDGN